MSRSHLRELGSVVAALLVATFTAVTPAYAADPTGTIAGTITDGDAPAADVWISIEADDGSFYGSGYTEQDGRYVVTDVPAATSVYRVVIYAPTRPNQWAPGQ